MSIAIHALSDRDVAILRMFYAYEGCVIDHVRLRFFPTPGGRTPCYRRIAYLVEHGFLTSTRLPSLSGQGSGKAFLTIGPNARPILAQVLELSRSELARTRMDSPMFIAHHLALCDVRLAFELAAERSAVFTLQDWTGDRELHQSPIRVKDAKTGNELPIIPDSALTLVLPDGRQQSFLIEMDMGTIAPKRMRLKLRAYLFRKGDPTPVLFVVPNESRQSAITQWALEEAQDLDVDPTIFWITLKPSLAEDTVLSASIWQVVGVQEAFSLESRASDLSQLSPTNEYVLASAQTFNRHGGALS